jgi:hypothetical protein
MRRDQCDAAGLSDFFWRALANGRQRPITYKVLGLGIFFDANCYSRSYRHKPELSASLSFALSHSIDAVFCAAM